MVASEEEMKRDLEGVTAGLASRGGWLGFVADRVDSWCKGEAALRGTNPVWKEGYPQYWL